MLHLFPNKRPFDCPPQKLNARRLPSLSFIVLALAWASLAGCAPIQSADIANTAPTPNPSLPPVLTSTLEDTPVNSTTTLAPQTTATVAETPIPVSEQDREGTATDEAVLHMVQTQFAQMEHPSTATPCSGACLSATPSLTPRITRTPTPSRTPSPPLAYLRILQPGPMSKVTSPINLNASVIPGPDGVVRVELYGEDGRLLSRQVLRYGMPQGMRFGISAKIDFEIPGVAEAGRLQVRVDDAAGRPIALSSVDLVLLSVGNDELNPAPPPLEPFVILLPTANQVVSGGDLVISGLARPLNGEPLILELYDNQGNVISSRQVQVDPDPDGSAVPFTTDIPYKVSAQTPVRLIVRQPDEHVPGDVAISSLTLTLAP